MKRWWYIAGSVMLLLACVLCGVLFGRNHPKETVETQVQAVLEERVVSPPEAVEDVPEPLPYESPIDFQSLWEMNPDIYAWIQIPGIEVSYPILQREGDDSYYLRRDSAGNKNKRGCIFTESTYNSQDFTDPVTLVYGHYVRDGSMFGSLQNTYVTEEGMEENREIVIYLPDQELRYQIFAAVPFNKWHILHYFDFSNPDEYRAFLNQVSSVRSMNANVDKTVRVEPEDRLLILSTCLRGDNQQRFLVLAKRMDEP